MKAIEQYAMFWQPEHNVGSIHLALSDGTGADIKLDSPAEASLLVDILRNESPCYWNVHTGQISTGLEPVGEEETKTTKKKSK